MSAQDEIVRALREPSFYPHRPESVHHLQTHISHVFVAGAYTYKLKKAVRFSFADFSTAELRQRFCLEELRLNRRLCAPIYLGVRALTRERDGTLALDGPGERLDSLVRMRTLPADGMLPEALAAGRVALRHLEAFAAELARFHASVAEDPDAADDADPDVLCARWRHVLEDAAPMVGDLISPLDFELLSEFGDGFVRRHESLLRARAAAGHVRDGHGDLHAGNLCLVAERLPELDDAPVVEPGIYAFDCLEFSPELRHNDVASEVAFLAMDLEARGHPELARGFVAAYVAATGDRDLELLQPFYACHRACIRGMVLGLAVRSEEASAEERAAAAAASHSHFALAVRLAWGAGGPAIVAVGGLSGSGKTTLAVGLAATSGFHLLSSDEVRKRRAGLDPHVLAGEAERAALYGEEARLRVYAALAAEARATLASGRAVVLDATFHRRAERAPVLELARELACPVIFLDCVADEATVRARLEARARGGVAAAAGQPALSDAGLEVYLAQRERAEPLAADEPALRVDATGTPDEVRERATRALWHWRQQQATRAPAAAPHPRGA